MKRGKRQGSFQISLDSFLDILTNTMGALMLIAVLACLVSLQYVYKNKTPLYQETEKAVVLFECRNGQLFQIDTGFFRQKLSDLNATSVYNSSYSARFMGANILLEPKQDSNGQSIAEITKPLSDYQMLATKLNPNKEFAFFLVRPDSFDIYRVAREVMRHKKIEVGWEPFKEDRQIILGTGSGVNPLGFQ